MIVRYKNSLVTSTHFDVRNDQYHLYDADDNLVDILSRPAFLSNPHLRMLPNGRHRGTNSSHNRSASNAPSGSGGNSPYGISPGAAAIRPGGVTRTSLPLVQWRTINHLYLEDFDPRPPLRRDGIIAGEIIGYRCWIIDRGLLRSVYQDDVWLPGETLVGRELEDWGNRGVHAWKDPGSKHYHDYIRAYLNRIEHDLGTMMILFGTSSHPETRNPRPAMITGSVYLWGDVVEHQRGYRAEFARVRSLDWLYPDESMMGQEQEVLNRFRSKYGV